jgi:hypothetical protein
VVTLQVKTYRCTPIISIGKQKQENLRVQSQPRQHGKFQASLCSTVRSCLKTKGKPKTKPTLLSPRNTSFWVVLVPRTGTKQVRNRLSNTDTLSAPPKVEFHIEFPAFLSKYQRILNLNSEVKFPCPCPGWKLYFTEVLIRSLLPYVWTTFPLFCYLPDTDRHLSWWQQPIEWPKTFSISW